jgi:adenine-specific DNA-methyltransferase
VTATAVRPGDPDEARKARGAFFTPPELCDYIAAWAIRSPDDHVLEPSCGEAAFLLAAGQRLDALGADPDAAHLHGVELHAFSATAAMDLTAAAGWPARVTVGDFFSVPADRRFDAVIGNPPYVRYQDFTGDSRSRARTAALAAGVTLTGLASSWAAFTVHATQFVKPGGRLGLVLPAELLTVNYAAEVRRHLMASFGRVRLVLFTERVFPGVMEEVVLLLAEDAHAAGGTRHCELSQVRTVAELLDDMPGNAQVYRWTPRTTHGKWTPALLSASALHACSAVEASGFATLHAWGETTLGMVTGNNGYFALSPARATELGLPTHEMIRLSPPGSRHLRGLSLTETAWEALGRQGSATWMFRPPADLTECSTHARRYIAEGEERGVHHLNSVHGVYLHKGRKVLGKDLLPLASLNTMTLLGAETVGRAYGGGMLKLEPKEADLLPVPGPDLLASCRRELAAVRSPVAAALRAGNLVEASRLVDNVVLVGALGASRQQVEALEDAHRALTGRRLARGKASRTTASGTGR